MRFHSGTKQQPDLINIDAPNGFRPPSDRVAIRRLPDDDRIGSIFLPDSGRDKTKDPVWLGEVVHVGRGEKLFRCRCKDCGNYESRREMVVFPLRHERSASMPDRKLWMGSMRCHECGGALEVLQLPWSYRLLAWALDMQDVKPGDRVLYRHTNGEEALVNGEILTIVHLEQHVLAVLEAA